MVSNALNMVLKDLLNTLARLRREFGDSSEYKTWRKEFPKNWPI